MDSELRTSEALQGPDIPKVVSGELGPELDWLISRDSVLGRLIRVCCHTAQAQRVL